MWRSPSAFTHTIPPEPAVASTDRSGDGAGRVCAASAVPATQLEGRPRDACLVATKAGGSTLTPDEVFADCNASLQRLGLDVIDLYQVHWHRRVVPIAETIAAMIELVRRGNVRYLGLCNSGPGDIAEATAGGAAVVSDHVVYNRRRAAGYALTEVCQNRKIGMLCHSPLAQVLLAGRYRHPDESPADRTQSRHFVGPRPMSRHGEPGCERAVFDAIETLRSVAGDGGLSLADLSMARLRHRPDVACVPAGASRPEQARANASAADIRLDDALIALLDAATEAVKRCMGPNLDMWQGGDRSRVR